MSEQREDQFKLTKADYDRWQTASKGTFWDHLGCVVEEATLTKVVISLQIEYHHLNLIGILHGGVHATLLDSAMGLMAMVGRPTANVVTVNLNVNYVASVGEGKVIVTAEPVHSSRKLVTVQAYARTEKGDLLAFGTGTFRVKDLVDLNEREKETRDGGEADGND